MSARGGHDGDRHPHPAVCVDTVVIHRHAAGPRVLLVRRRGPPFQHCWALPGGFVEIDEPLDAAAARELREETGLAGLPLEQLRAFGAPDRDPRERVISIAYRAEISGAAPAIRPGDDAAEVAWFPLAALPPLAFDHAEIIAAALR